MEDPKIVAERIIENIERVIIGKERELRLAVTALLCGGHMLIEDVPGVGKTMLARAIAISTGCTFKRIQFTPDLLPSDVTGVSIYNQKEGDFEFREGPIIAQDCTQIDHADTVDDLIAQGQETECSVLTKAVKAHCEHRVMLHAGRTVVFK